MVRAHDKLYFESFLWDTESFLKGLPRKSSMFTLEKVNPQSKRKKAWKIWSFVKAPLVFKAYIPCTLFLWITKRKMGAVFSGDQNHSTKAN